MDMIGKFKPTLLDTVIRIEAVVTIHYFKYSKEFIFGGEKHDFWEMHYVDKGEVGVFAENQGLDLCQGEAIFHKPDEYHNIWAKNVFANVVVLTFVCNSPAMSLFENKLIVLNEEQRTLLGNIVHAGEIYFEDPLDDVWQTEIRISNEAPFGCLQILKNYVELFLISLIQSNEEIVRKTRVSVTVKRQGECRVVAAIKEVLDENLYVNFTFKDVMEHVSFSKSHIIRLFREQTGYSVMDYYRKQKIAEAERLISERELSFTQIAEALCFQSIHYFSRAFKKQTGMTPSEYRRSVRASAIL